MTPNIVTGNGITPTIILGKGFEMLIKVTANDVGTTWINDDYIISITGAVGKIGAVIVMTNGALLVSESMDEVVDMLEGRDEDEES